MLEIKVELPDINLPDLSPGQISKVTRSVAARVRDAMQKSTPRDTGKTKRSWTGVKKVDGGYSFKNPSAAAGPLEYGSASGKRPWPSVGPRTVYNQDDGRIYSTQAPQGISAQAGAEEVARKVAEELIVKISRGESLRK